MSRFLRAVENEIPEKVQSRVSARDLRKWGLTGIELKVYQLNGVWWLTQCLKTLQGCILGDEMGLGKTCQTISLLVYARGHLRMKGPFLVLCPLSTLNVWRQHLNNLCPRMRVVVYRGEKTEREELQREMEDKPEHILLTNYEMLRIDASVFKRWKWDILVADEAQSLKNENAKVHKILTECSLGFKLLLTGTPIQNNLQELYSLLSFIQPSVFPPRALTEFLTMYEDIRSEKTKAAELHRVLRPFLLRRVKAEVEKGLPEKMNVVVYHGMSALQKKYYKAILMKDLDVFKNDRGKQNRLQNVLMQLRKCVNHPYMFMGVEPEPFVLGEHLVEASGKLSLLDSMLAYIKKGGHRVLLFSQMTRMLDIVQDYLGYRGYSYERLDGSVRGEERNLAINNFSENEVFIFLLSTKAGGVGLNLTAADTVIFLDSDFNPQNDLQAEARAHRIGQTRPVKVIRLLGRDTVEEIVYSYALPKLALTNVVIQTGQFNLQSSEPSPQIEMNEILFGIHRLLSTDESTVQPLDLRPILGESRDGHWLIDKDQVMAAEEEEDEDEDEYEGTYKNMYCFEGKDYSKLSNPEDMEHFQYMQDEQAPLLEDAAKEGFRLRSNAGDETFRHLSTPTRQKRTLTESELEERRQKRQEAAAKRAKLQEEKERQQQERKYKKKMAWWASCGYTSLCLPSVDSEGEDMDEEEDDDAVSTDSRDTDIRYVLGDVTHPQAEKEDVIIIHCVDDSGWWGRGGLFTALELRSDEVKKQYERAGEMEDLELGNVLLFPIDDKQSRQSGRDYLALIVAQRRDKANKLSGIYLTALDEGLKKIYRAAKQKKASVHLPRIGHATKGFNWYGTERLIRKHLAFRGIPTSIYYYKRTSSQSAATAAPSANTAIPSTSRSALSLPSSSSPCSLSPPGPSKEQADSPGDSSDSQMGGEASGLSDFMTGVCVFFYNVGATERKKLARYLITYDGDEIDIMSSQVTHIVAELESPVHVQELKDLCKQYPQAILVKTKWLESCYANQRKVSTSKFIHVLK